MISRLTFALTLWIALFVPLASHAEANGPVAIVVSSDEPAYTATAEAFSKELGGEVRTFNLDGDAAKAASVMEKVLALKPRLVYALGAKAAFAAKTWTADHHEIPVLFSKVLNWERYGLAGKPGNVAGISDNPDPGTLLANVILSTPKLKKVGVVYSKEHSGELVERTRAAAKLLGLELVQSSVNSPQQFQRGVKEILPGLDALIVLADPVVYTVENMQWLQTRCAQDRLVCVGSSRNIAAMGMLLGIASDDHALGAQAATLARQILDRGIKPADIGVVSPLGTRLVVNLKTARILGLPSDAELLNRADEIVGN